MKLNKRRWYIISGVLLSIFVVIPIVVSIVLTPTRLSKITTAYSKDYINGNVTFSSVKINLFEHFPYATLVIDDGEVLSRVLDGDTLLHGADTLLQFKRLSVAINPITMLSSTITFRYIGIDGLRLNGVVAEDGRANWDILIADTTSESSSPMSVALRELKISGGLKVDYVDHKISDSYHFAMRDLNLKGYITDKQHKLKIDEFNADGISISGEMLDKKTEFKTLISLISITREDKRNFLIDIKSSNSVKQDSVNLCQQLPVELTGGLKFDSLAHGKITLDNLKLKIADIASVFNGSVIMKKDSILSDVVCTINPLLLAGVLDLLPEELVPIAKDISTDIAIDLKSSIKGSYVKSTGRLPAVNLDVKIDRGFVVYEKTRARLDTVQCDLTLAYVPEKANVKCNMRRVVMRGSGLNVEVKALIDDILTDPFLKGKFVVNLDLKKLSESFPSSKGITAAGELLLDMNVEAKESWMNIRQVGRSTIVGHMVFADMIYDSPKDSVHIIAKGGVSFGSIVNKKDSVLGINSRIIGVSTQIDTMNLHYKGNDLLALRNLKMSARSSSTIFRSDSTKTVPMDGVISSDLITCKGPDSTILLFHKLSGVYTIIPSKEYAAAPHINTDFKCKTIYVRGNPNRYVINDAEVNLNSTMLTKGNMLASRRELAIDSLQKLYPTTSRDSLLVIFQKAMESIKDDFKSNDIDMTITGSLSDLLVKWGTTGLLKADSARVITPYLPLKNSVKNVDIKFTQNEVNIKNTNFIIGNSKINLTAKVSNIARALTRGGKLRIATSLTADSIDFNQLNHAIINGMKFSERSVGFKDSLVMSSSNEEVEQMISQTNEQPTSDDFLLVIPSNIDINLSLDVDNCRYKTLLIECMKGSVISKDRCLQIKDLTATTSAGVIDFSAVYSTKSKNELTTGFDLVMKDIEVAGLISLIPQIDSLLPMLRSFDGVVDCRMAATASLDTAMNIVLPSLNAACVINGENMVLLDGETFSEIAKTLRFKNKKRNKIEKISVELLVKDNKIEIFPFIAEIDRYQTAISGVHNLDLTYKYHISVIHSPLPFRIGIDITGDAEDFKFKLTRARFKNANIPSYVDVIDNARINLRDKIINIFKVKGIKEMTAKDLNISPQIDTISIMPSDQPLTAADSVAIHDLETMK